VALPALEIYAIYVMPEAWRSGVGGALLSTAVDHWRESGVTALVLWVLEANSAGRAFYEAMGWQPDGIRQLIDLGGFTVAEVRYRLDHA
jgi:GNAT superfamily N-acetyltransferase